MSEKRIVENIRSNSIEDRLRGLEIQMSQLATEMRHLAETAATSQVQMAEQSKIQTDLLITMQRDRAENAAIAEHVTGLVEDVSDLRTWVSKQKGGMEIKSGIRALVAVTGSGIVISAFAFWLSFKFGGP